MPLFHDKFNLAYSPNSKWMTSSDLKEPMDESVLLLEDGHCMRDHALSACKLKNIDKVSRYSASSMLTLIEMVKSDIGVTYLPEISLDSHLVNQSGLEIHMLEDNSFREIGLVWRKGSSRVNEFKLLGEYIKENHKQ
jgi:LysR family hydrogen peroxide-inducible transcriptional activator